MAIERTLLENDTVPPKAPAVIPTGFYEGRDPLMYANIAEQNRTSVVGDKASAEEGIKQLLEETDTLSEAELVLRKKLELERARELCLDFAIPNPEAYEEMKKILLAQFSSLQLEGFDILDTTPDARVANLIESYFKRRRSYISRIQEARRDRKQALISQENKKYEQSTNNYRNVYYRDVWVKALPVIETINEFFPIGEKTSQMRTKKSK